MCVKLKNSSPNNKYSHPHVVSHLEDVFFCNILQNVQAPLVHTTKGKLNAMKTNIVNTTLYIMSKKVFNVTF